MATPKKPARRVSKPPRKRPYKPRRVDWESLRVEYVTGGESLLEVAKRRDVHSRTVKDRAARDGWAAAREKHRSDSAAKTQTVAVEWRAKTESEIHRIGHNIVLDMLAGAEKMAATMREGGMKPADTKAAIESVKSMIATARTTAGLPEVPTGPAPGTTSTGDTVIRRTAPDGSTVVVTVATP